MEGGSLGGAVRTHACTYVDGAATAAHSIIVCVTECEEAVLTCL